jgi:DNA-binding transcriptional MerR regulator
LTKEASVMLGINPVILRLWDNAGKLKAKRYPMNNNRVYKITEIELIRKKIVGVI